MREARLAIQLLPIIDDLYNAGILRISKYYIQVTKEFFFTTFTEYTVRPILDNTRLQLEATFEGQTFITVLPVTKTEDKDESV